LYFIILPLWFVVAGFAILAPPSVITKAVAHSMQQELSGPGQQLECG